jgi:hypothetical protein
MWFAALSFLAPDPARPCGRIIIAAMHAEVRLRDGEGEGGDGVIEHGFLPDVLDSQLSQSAGCKDNFAGEPAGIVRGKKRHDFGDVRWRTDAAQWRQSEELLLEVASRAQ